MSVQDRVTTTVTRITGRRYIIVVGLMIIMALAYLDRVNFSVAAPSIIKEFGLTTGDFGLLSSAFNWTYLVVLIPVGIISDKLGSKIGLPLAIILWSVAAALTGFSTGFVILLVVRLLMGIGEAPVTTVGQIVIREWAPVRERATISSLFTSGSLFGPAIGSVIAAFLIVSYGWRASFVVVGAFGVIVGIVWWLIYSTPERSRWLPERERDYIIANRDTTAGVEEGAGQKMGVLRLLRVPTVWGLGIAQGTLVYTSYLFLTFLPLYLVQQLKLVEFSAGWVTGVIYGVSTVLCLAIGFFSDRIARRVGATSRRLKTRRWTLVIVMLAGIPLLILPFVSSLGVIIAIVCWVLGFNYAGVSLVYTLTNELTVDKKAIGRQVALITIGGNIFGLLAPIVTGYIVQATGSYLIPFLLAAVLTIIGAVVVFFLARHPLQTRRALHEAELAGKYDSAA